MLAHANPELQVVTEVRGAQTEHLLGVQFVTDQGRESSMYGDDSTGKKFAFKARSQSFQCCASHASRHGGLMLLRPSTTSLWPACSLLPELVHG